MLKVKALSSISIEDVELAIGDADQSTAPKVNMYFYTKGVKQRLKFSQSEVVLNYFVILSIGE